MSATDSVIADSPSQGMPTLSSGLGPCARAGFGVHTEQAVATAIAMRMRLIELFTAYLLTTYTSPCLKFGTELQEFVPGEENSGSNESADAHGTQLNLPCTPDPQREEPAFADATASWPF